MIQSFECREGRQTQKPGGLKNITKQKIKGDEQEKYKQPRGVKEWQKQNIDDFLVFSGQEDTRPTKE